MAELVGHRKRIQVKDAGSSSGAYDEVEFVSESLCRCDKLLDSRGLTGNRSLSTSRTRLMRANVGGELTILATPAALQKWLPRVMGQSTNQSTFDLAPQLPFFETKIDRADDVFTYENCLVSRAQIVGVSGRPIEIKLQIEALDEAVQSGDKLAEASLPTDLPYMFGDLDLSIDSESFRVDRFELLIDNHLRKRFVNSVIATSINSTRSEFRLQFTKKGSTANDLLAHIEWPGSAVEFTLNDGQVVTRFLFGTIQNFSTSPHVDRRNETFQTVSGWALASGSEPALRVVQSTTT